MNFMCNGSGVCVCARDSCEDNDNLTQVCHAGTLSIGGVSVIASRYNIDAPGDDDFLHWSVNDATGTDSSVDISVGLSNIPSDANYNLEVTIDCMLSTNLSFSCIQGSPGVGRSCISANSGNASEAIVARTNCTVQGIQVHVIAVTTGAMCAPYTLTLSGATSGTT
jgi:hypothetical protein